jgi:hypothetical protein
MAQLNNINNQHDYCHTDALANQKRLGRPSYAIMMLFLLAGAPT